MFYNKYHFGNSNFSKKLFFKILVSFIVLVFLLVASFFFLFSNIYKSTVYENIKSETISSLDRFNKEFDGIFSQLSQMNISINQNESVNNFLYCKDYDYTIINSANNYLIQMKNMSAFLHSIILFNNNLNFHIFSSDVDVDTSQFAVQTLRRPKAKSKMMLILTSVGPGLTMDKSTSQTLSIVYSDYFDITKPLSSAIISTLDRNVIQKKLLDLFEGTTFIVDNEGNVIFNSSNATTEGASINSPIINEVISKKINKGDFTTKIKNDNKIVFFTKSIETDLYIINIRSSKNISHELNTKGNVILAVSLGILIIFCIAVFIFALKIYSPIKKVTEVFSNSKFRKKSDKLGEIDVITDVFNEVLNHLQNLEIKNVSNHQRLKEDSLRILLKSGAISDSIKNEIFDYGLSIEFSNLIIVSVRIDKYNQLDEDKCIAYQATLCRIIPKVLNDVFFCESVNMFDGEVVLLLNFKNKSNNSFDLLLDGMEKIKSLSYSTLHITTTIGIGGVANSMEECMKTYNSAQDMTKYRFTLGFNKIIYSKYLDDILESNIYYPSEIEDKLIKSIRSNNKVAFEENLHSIIEILKQYPYSDAVSIMFQIISSCIKVINQLIREDSQKFSINFDEFSSIFSELQTLDQTEAWLLNTFDEYQNTVENIVQLKNDKHFKVVEKVQEFIKENYHDINISTESVAEMVDYTPYYFSKVFKEISGLTVNNYIRQVRINKAKEYLSQPDVKINDIPGIIGFSTINHFYFIFKKDVGLTPAAYREYVLNHN